MEIQYYGIPNPEIKLFDFNNLTNIYVGPIENIQFNI
jgi:hypothetical protein